jgi:hypothetical protein
MMFCQVSATLTPNGLSIPKPVTTTRRLVTLVSPASCYLPQLVLQSVLPTAGGRSVFGAVNEKSRKLWRTCGFLLIRSNVQPCALT